MVAVATGRDMDSEFSKAYKKQLQPDAIVHSNGQKVTVGEKKIREVFMDPKLIARMMEFCREHHLCIGMNIGKYGCYVNKEVLMSSQKKFPRQTASRHFWTITRKTGLTLWHLETA